MSTSTRSKSKKAPQVTTTSLMTVSDTNTIYFWKPDQEHGYLGQWYPSTFKSMSPDGSNEFTYQDAEQFMMHRKGLLFAPESPITKAILETTNPRDIKALGRKVPGFDDDVWKRERINIVTEGTYLKFTQNEDIKTQLLATGDKELVEASPRDRIWGIGFGAKNAPSKRNKWGANLLGKALMDVRQRIRAEEELKSNDVEQ
ncbi:hypothetical protein RhiJN_22113 [Ceratobasidium sp. AG-Ba]|nr:hypothetical protein RhiJN_22113 [Ceratobasidium sp. AG-Ba]